MGATILDSLWTRPSTSFGIQNTYVSLVFKLEGNFVIAPSELIALGTLP